MTEGAQKFKCPKCKSVVMERRAGLFHWQGRYFHGLVCPACTGLWSDPLDSFAEHVGIDEDALEEVND